MSAQPPHIVLFAPCNGGRLSRLSGASADRGAKQNVHGEDAPRTTSTGRRRETARQTDPPGWCQRRRTGRTVSARFLGTRRTRAARATASHAASASRRQGSASALAFAAGVNPGSLNSPSAASAAARVACAGARRCSAARLEQRTAGSVWGTSLDTRAAATLLAAAENSIGALAFCDEHASILD